MPWSRVQSASNTASSASSCVVTLSSTVTAGDLVVVLVAETEPTTPGGGATVYDNTGNAYSEACAENSAGTPHARASIWYAIAGSTVASLAITYSAGTGSADLEVVAVEYSGGTGTLDGTGTAGGSGTSLSSGSFTTTGTDVLAGVAVAKTTGQKWSGGGGFNVLASSTGSGSAVSCLFEDKLNAGAGSGSATMSDTVSGAWVVAAAAFSIGSGYTLTASEGSYSLTGISADVYYGYTLAAGAGSYSFTGDSAALLWDHALHASEGVYGLTGQNASLLADLNLSAGPGSYGLSGDSATLTAGRLFDTVPGSYSLSGFGALLYEGQVLFASPGVYSIARIPSHLTVQRLLEAEPGSYTLGGATAGLQAGYKVDASPGGYSLAGENAGMTVTRSLEAGDGIYVLTGLGVGMFPLSALGIGYQVYSNSGAGDPINYESPVATIVSTTTTWTSSALSYPGTWSFGVRAFNSEGDEQNIECAVTIVLDAGGIDITARPAPPPVLRAFATAGGSIRVEWFYPPTLGPKAPTGFHVYIGTGGAPSYGSPAATVLFSTGVANSFVANLAGFTGGTTYTIGVRAYNATAEEPNTNTTQVTAITAGPAPVDALAGIATAAS